MPRRNAFDSFVEEIARRVVERVGELMPKGRGGRGRSKLRGRKLDMRCRHPGCRNRSKGPRFHFLCEDHLKK